MRRIGVVAKRLTAVNVGNVNFEDRRFKSVERVENGNRGVAEGAGIDHQAGGVLARCVDPVDQLVFGIALMKGDGQTEFVADPPAIGFDIGQGGMAVDVRN